MTSAKLILCAYFQSLFFVDNSVVGLGFFFVPQSSFVLDLLIILQVNLLGKKTYKKKPNKIKKKITNASW